MAVVEEIERALERPAFAEIVQQPGDIGFGRPAPAEGPAARLNAPQKASQRSNSSGPTKPRNKKHSEREYLIKKHVKTAMVCGFIIIS